MSTIEHFETVDFRREFIERVVKEDTQNLLKLYDAGCLEIVDSIEDETAIVSTYREWFRDTIYTNSDKVIDFDLPLANYGYRCASNLYNSAREFFICTCGKNTNPCIKENESLRCNIPFGGDGLLKRAKNIRVFEDNYTLPTYKFTHLSSINTGSKKAGTLTKHIIEKEYGFNVNETRKNLAIPLNPKNFKVSIALNSIILETDNISNFKIIIEKTEGGEIRHRIPTIIYGTNLIIKIKLRIDIFNKLVIVK